MSTSSIVDSRYVALVFGASEAHLVPMYSNLGQRPCAPRNFFSDESGYLIPNVSIPLDVTAARESQRPPEYGIAFDWRNGTTYRALPTAVQRLLAEFGAVRCPALTATTTTGSTSTTSWNQRVNLAGFSPVCPTTRSGQSPPAASPSTAEPATTSSRQAALPEARASSSKEPSTSRPVGTPCARSDLVICSANQPCCLARPAPPTSRSPHLRRQSFVSPTKPYAPPASTKSGAHPRREPAHDPRHQTARRPRAHRLAKRSPVCSGCASVNGLWTPNADHRAHELQGIVGCT